MLDPTPQSTEAEETETPEPEQALPDLAELDSLTAELDQIDTALGDLAS